MLFTSSALEARLSDLMKRIQRLEKEHAELQARLRTAQANAAARGMAAEVSMAVRIALVIGAAVEGFAAAMRCPLKRGTAGGIARARQAARLCERWSNGRYMSHDESEQIERDVAQAEYMRYAAGGFMRAGTAARTPDGRFSKQILSLKG